MPRPVLPALVLAAIALPGSAFSEPTSFDECILETMKGVSSDIAAQAIIQSCRSMFPEEDAASEAAATATASHPAPVDQAATTGAAPAAAATATAAGTAATSSSSAAAAPAASTAAATAPPAEAEPPSAGTVRSLSEDELDKLEYRGTFLGTSYRVKVFNGNENLRLTEVTIAVWDKDYIPGLETYRAEVDIAPMDEGTAKYTVVYDGQEETWAWKLFSAKGSD